VFEKDRPIRVAVFPEATVAVTVVGLPEVPILLDTFDLNAIIYPSAIAIAIASFVASVVLYTSKLVRAVEALVKSLRLFAFSDLSEFKLVKLASTSLLVRGDPLPDLVVIVDIVSPP
jgi:hypothetical protein